MPMVSVIIPCLNSERFLRQAIDSVLAQTLTDREVVCVDNGSTDATLEILGSYGDQVRVVHESRRGAPCARNTGVRESDGAFVAFLDSDDYWEPEKLQRQVSAAEENPEAGLICTDYWLLDQREGCEEVSSVLRPPRVNHLDGLFERCCIHTSTMMVPRRVLDKVGLFREDLPMSDDYDLLLRIAEGWVVVTIPQPLSTFRVHGTGLSSRSHMDMVSCTDRVLDAFCERRPEFLARKRGRRARQRTAVARLLLAGDRRRAAALYLDSARLVPAQAAAYAGLIMCALPLPYGAIRDFLRRTGLRGGR